MSERVNKFCTALQSKLNHLDDRMNSLKNNLPLPPNRPRMRCTSSLSRRSKKSSRKNRPLPRPERTFRTGPTRRRPRRRPLSINGKPSTRPKNWRSAPTAPRSTPPRQLKLRWPASTRPNRPCLKRSPRDWMPKPCRLVEAGGRHCKGGPLARPVVQGGHRPPIVYVDAAESRWAMSALDRCSEVDPVV